jgi:hypothetical protein
VDYGAKKKPPVKGAGVRLFCRRIVFMTPRSEGDNGPACWAVLGGMVGCPRCPTERTTDPELVPTRWLHIVGSFPFSFLSHLVTNSSSATASLAVVRMCSSPTSQT